MNLVNMTATEIKESLGFNVNEIVEPSRLAEKLGVEIFETSLDQKQDGARIVCAIVNKEHPSVFYHKMLIDSCGTERVATTYALVHCVVFGVENLMITSRTIMTEKEEMLIYEFLMPQFLVAEELKNGASINDLSKRFNVPKKCVRERLDAMPVALINSAKTV